MSTRRFSELHIRGSQKILIITFLIILPQTETLQQWSFETGIQIRTSDRFKIMLGLILVFAVTGVLGYNRIRNVEKRNEVLQAQLDTVHSTLNEIMLRLSVSSDTDTDNQVPTPFEIYSGPSVPVDNTEEVEYIDRTHTRTSNPSSSRYISRIKRSLNTTDLEIALLDLSSSNNRTDDGSETDESFVDSQSRKPRRIKERGRGKRRKIRQELTNLKLSNSRRCTAISDLHKAKLMSSTSGSSMRFFPS